MAAAEARCDLDHLRAVRPDPELRVARTVLDPERAYRGFCDLGRLAARLTRPHMRQRNPEGRRLGRQPVGHGQRMEVSAQRERVHRHLGPVDELLDDRHTAARLLDRAPDRGRKLILRADERQALLPLPVRRLHHRRHGQPFFRFRDDVPARLRHLRLRERLALLLLRDGPVRDPGVDRVRQSHPLGDACGDSHRPVDARGDDPLDALGRSEALDALLVLGRDDRPPVGVPEPGRGRVAVERDHEQPLLASRPEQSELRRPGP